MTEGRKDTQQHADDGQMDGQTLTNIKTGRQRKWTDRVYRHTAADTQTEGRGDARRQTYNSRV